MVHCLITDKENTFFVVIVQIYFLLIIITKPPNLIEVPVVHFYLTTPNLEHYRHRKSPLSAPRLRKNKAMCFVFLSKESRQCAVLISAVYTSKFAGI